MKPADGIDGSKPGGPSIAERRMQQIGSGTKLAHGFLQLPLQQLHIPPHIPI
jgi:hypothetical protein